MVAADVRSLLPANLKQKSRKQKFISSLFAFFYLKNVSKLKNLAKILTEIWLKQIGEPSLSLIMKPITMFL